MDSALKPAVSQPEALKAGVAGDGLADAGPVDVLALLGDRLQQMVAHQAQQWHGHAALVGGLADQSHVLQAERRLEAGGAISGALRYIARSGGSTMVSCVAPTGRGIPMIVLSFRLGGPQ